MQTFAARLRDSLSDIETGDPILDAHSSTLSILRSRPSAVRTLAYKKLHVYPFENVPLCWRRAYEDACLWEAVNLLEKPGTDSGNGDEENLATKIVQLADSAVIFAGAPFRRSLINELLEVVAKQIEDAADRVEARSSLRAAKRRRLDSDGASKDGRHPKLSRFLSGFRSQPLPCVDALHAVARVKAPSLTAFAKHLNHVRAPLIITHSVDHWPAISRWNESQYWLESTHGGRRLVPVELGRSYIDEGWGQKIMPFGEYLRDHVLRDVEADRADCTTNVEIGANDGTDMDGTAKPPIGYLAQHDLLGQVPALRNDVSIPDYCYLDPPRKDSPQEDDDEPTEPQLNIWLGPAGTISPAHTDPHENILAQVVGRKYVRLFAPNQGDKMYPMGRSESAGEDAESKEVNMSNTSRVDVGSYVTWSNDEQQGKKDGKQDSFPLHSQAEYVEAVLEAGDCLYIPRGWWHYIQSLSASCSVSFWWD